MNTEGSYNCICRNGYMESKSKELTPSGKRFRSVIRYLAWSVHPSYQPSMNLWLGDIIASCIDIDECKTPDACNESDELTVCLNTIGHGFSDLPCGLV